MTLSAEIWRLGCSENSVTIDIIQNIWKTNQVSKKIKLDNKLKIQNVNISNKLIFGVFMDYEHIGSHAKLSLHETRSVHNP